MAAFSRSLGPTLKPISTVMLMKLFLRTLILAGGVSLALAGPPPDIAESVLVLRAVGPEGQGNAAAAFASSVLRPLLMVLP